MSLLRSVLYYMLSAFTLFTGPIVWLVFRLIYGERGRIVQKVSDPLLMESCTTLAKKIRSREVSFFGVFFNVSICKYYFIF